VDALLVVGLATALHTLGRFTGIGLARLGRDDTALAAALAGVASVIGRACR
jgi:hypothetical protein